MIFFPFPGVLVLCSHLKGAIRVYRGDWGHLDSGGRVKIQKSAAVWGIRILVNVCYVGVEADGVWLGCDCDWW